VVEGVVKVVLDAGAQTEVEMDEILVCPITDPSWVPLMMLAGALVIDIGSTASLRRPKSRRCRSSGVSVFVDQTAKDAGASQSI
jgi:phosphoenolpyruvate synthase/pyruvate phosphate dikinase